MQQDICKVKCNIFLQNVVEQKYEATEILKHSTAV